MKNTMTSQIKVSVPVDLLPLVPGYLERREKDVHYLMDMLAGRNFSAIGEVAHKLKGSGRGYGLDVYTELGTDLEKAAASRDRLAIKNIIEKIEASTWAIRKHLQDSA